MKNFLKLTVTFFVSNFTAFMFFFLLEGRLFDDSAVIFYSVPIVISVIIQLLAVMIFKFNYSKSYYISLGLYTVLLFAFAWCTFFNISGYSIIFDNLRGFCAIPDVLANSVSSDSPVLGDNKVFGLFVCTLITAISVALMFAAKPISEKLKTAHKH